MSSGNGDKPSLEELRCAGKNLRGLHLWGQTEIKKRYGDNPDLSQMIQSIDFTIQCLTDENAPTRLLALNVLAVFYPDSDIDHLLDRFEEMAFEGPNREVRISALRYVGRIACDCPSEIKKNKGKRICEVVFDTSIDPKLRDSAYRALCSLSSDYYTRMSSCDDLRFPEDVDWEYVRSWQ